MEKGKLTQLLANFTNEDALSAELYFVLRNNDNIYELYSTSPEPGLIKEIISSYSEELTKYSDPHSAYEVHSVFTDNENNWNYLYFDIIDRTKVASEVFGTDTAEVSPYTLDKGDYSSIFGFVVDIYNGATNEKVRIFKKAMPTQAMKKSKVFGITLGKNGKYVSMESDAVFFQKNIDLFKVGDNIIIRNYGIYESSFKFDEILKNKVQNSLKLLLKVPGFEFTDNALQQIAKLNNTTRRKLINCVDNNKILSDEKYTTIRSQARRYLKHEFNISLAKKIIINSKKDVTSLITILNREINKNSATNEVFHTPTKKLLSVYIPKKK